MAPRPIATFTYALLSASLIIGPSGCGEDPVEAIGPVADESDDEIGSDDDGSTDEGESGSGAETSSTDEGSTDDGPTESTTETTDDDESTESTTETTTDDDESTESTTETTESTTDTGDTSCASPISFEVLAEDYAQITGGWELSDSEYEQHQVLYMPPESNQGSARFDIDVPCDDTWHVWVRAAEQGGYDSFFIRVDGVPGPGQAIFELDCTDWPDMFGYKWKQLNYRSPNDWGCDYMFNPWTHDWDAGVHSVELAYRESWAISKLWITNTDQSPP